MTRSAPLLLSASAVAVALCTAAAAADVKEEVQRLRGAAAAAVSGNLTAQALSADGDMSQCAGIKACDPWASDNVEDAFYCSPFGFVPHTSDYQDCVSRSGDATVGDFLDKWAGGPDRAQAWCEKDNPNPSNYFVIHGCDGSGIQTDCMGDTWYVELFGPLDDNDHCSANDGGDGWGFDCEVSSGSEDDLVHCQHQKCTFRHPMTNRNYQYYSCGWWGIGSYGESLNGQTVIGAESWMNGQAGLRDANSCDDGDLSKCNHWNAYFFLYAWTCHKDDTSKNTDWFTGVSGRNCYCDNEPWSIGMHGKPDADPPSMSTMLPYVGRWFDDDTIGLSKVDWDGSHTEEKYYQKCETGKWPW